MRVRFHCEVCDGDFASAEEAAACEKQEKGTPHGIGRKMICFGQVVRISERSAIGKRTHDYLYRAVMRRDENPGDATWDSQKWLHHSKFKPIAAEAPVG